MQLSNLMLLLGLASYSISPIQKNNDVRADNTANKGLTEQRLSNTQNYDETLPILVSYYNKQYLDTSFNFDSSSLNDEQPHIKKIDYGQASYYGGRHNGRRTANGEIFNSSKFTAAHRTLPFGTRVNVTNLVNGRSCTVKINDRGPAAWTGRIIDLSTRAAQCLDMTTKGIVKVTLSVIRNK